MSSRTARAAQRNPVSKKKKKGKRKKKENLPEAKLKSFGLFSVAERGDFKTAWY